MKEFIVTIDRTVKQVRVITIKAENKEQAYDAAADIAEVNEGWDAAECDTDYEINIEEIIEEEPNDYIDRDGNPYTDESWPAGGGLHKDCEFNADALYAYYIVGDRYKIADYLHLKHFARIMYSDDREEWVKGNTKIIYEGYGMGLWGYMHTELI